MLQIKNVFKQYKTGNFVQKALDDVSLNLRDNEFVAILGPSGSGKTTLLNIIGGLDHYDSGDLIINEISTKKYKDRDWDSYRNHTIGFVFQSYNLIPHQTILANVELALTISGISKSERKKRAQEALDKVGLGKQVHKKPNQLSGGQMQRVAIARALVNDPDILLADEPTGALDSDTSVQVMDLLQEVAKDRLVVMVTHNPELAEQYATRIVNLRDGKIRSDSNPFEIEENKISKPQHKNMGKTSMSWLTALALSFNNLKTKKGRTLLTAFAGSIGIIGIAAILSLSNGVNNYIKNIEEETLSEYPVQIQSSGFDMSAMLTEPTSESGEETNGDMATVNMLTTMFSTIGSNDLESLKKFIDSNESDIKNYTNAIEYSYNVDPQIYSSNIEKLRQVHPDQSFSSMGLGSGTSTNSMMSTMMSTNVFGQMPDNKKLYEEQYDVKAGKWPSSYNECVLVLTSSGNISDFLLYSLGLRDAEELDKMVEQFTKEEEVDVPKISSSYNYDEILGITFKLVNASDYYVYDQEYDIWKNKSEDTEYMKNLVINGEDLKIVGIVEPKEDASAAMLAPGIYYTSDLVTHVINKAKESEIVKAQIATPDKNVFTGKSFDSKDNSENAFKMESLFSVDEKLLQSAFKIDTSKMNVDLSNLNTAMTSISLPALDINSIVSQINVQLSEEQVKKLINDLIKGYAGYTVKHPEADLSKFSEQFMKYLQTPEVTQKIKATIEEIIKNNQEISITQEQMQAILKNVLVGYDEYAKENNLPSTTDLSKYFMDYLQSGEAKSIITQNLTDFVQSNGLETQISSIMQNYMQSVMGTVSGVLEKELMASMAKLSGAMQDAFGFDANIFKRAIKINMTEDDLAELMVALMTKKNYSYDSNLKDLGYAEFESPSQISIYPKNFESKEQVINILDSYNERMEKAGEDDKVITYTDLVGSLMSSVTDIINVISYVLVAFVAISLVVSSIMIGVITYISVLERKKEIGILRAMGASKRNISQVFNAETFIIGLLAGIMGIGVTLLLLIPANQLIHSISGQTNINASLPIIAGVVLIILSTVLTLIGGIIPSKKAAKEDPVTALRTE